MLDGQPGGATSHLKFPVYPILYPENSVHALSVLSLDRQGVLHYSQGMAGTLILSDIWKDENKVESADGLALSDMGAEVMADSGTLVSKTFTAAQHVLAVRLHTSENPGAGGSISYEVSTDHGATWTAIREESGGGSRPFERDGNGSSRSGHCGCIRIESRSFQRQTASACDGV